MHHYVCSECGGVSEEQKNCETEGCSRHGQPLADCNCEDGLHTEAMSKGGEEETSM